MEAFIKLKQVRRRSWGGVLPYIYISVHAHTQMYIYIYVCIWSAS